jgi:Zn finger protein HypA/HybF involved in hydrogenase expression
MTNKRCPKCGGRNFQICDYYAVAYLYEVTNGFVEADGMDDEFPEKIRTVCVCRDCGHQWNPKKLEYEIDA